MRKILKALLMIQEKQVKSPIGPSYRKIRMNPYNPLSYIYILLAFIVGLFMFGFVGIWKEMDLKNPFKYQ
jgi:hypothetical protein